MRKMIGLLFMAFTLFFVGCFKDPVITIKNITGTFIDSRDNHIYQWVQIGEQVWMAENLAYLPFVSPPSAGSATSPYYYIYGFWGTGLDDALANSNYTTYGVLYNWDAAKTACPSGWHLPTDAEWTTFTDYLEVNGYGYGNSGNNLGKSVAATSGFTSSSYAGAIGNRQSSNNLSGFTALPGGSRNSNGGFNGLSKYALFWSASEYDALTAWLRNLGYDDDGVYRNHYTKSDGFSVRCLQQ